MLTFSGPPCLFALKYPFVIGRSLLTKEVSQCIGYVLVDGHPPVGLSFAELDLKVVTWLQIADLPCLDGKQLARKAVLTLSVNSRRSLGLPRRLVLMALRSLNGLILMVEPFWDGLGF